MENFGKTPAVCNGLCCTNSEIGLMFPLQNGFDYLLTYRDDPQTVFPRYCVSWMVSSGELYSSETSQICIMLPSLPFYLTL